MNRWMLEIRDYRYKIEYKSGKRNVVSDQLSRPVRVIQGSEDGEWLGKSREEMNAESGSKMEGYGRLSRRW